MQQDRLQGLNGLNLNRTVDIRHYAKQRGGPDLSDYRSNQGCARE